MAAKTALVLETNSLRGGAGMAQTVDSLKRLVSALLQQTVPPAALVQWVITHHGLPADACAEITALAGRPIDFVEIGANTANYDAKNGRLLAFACGIGCVTSVVKLARSKFAHVLPKAGNSRAYAA